METIAASDLERVHGGKDRGPIARVPTDQPINQYGCHQLMNGVEFCRGAAARESMASDAARACSSDPNGAGCNALKDLLAR
jgi:hypothetical protein